MRRPCAVLLFALTACSGHAPADDRGSADAGGAAYDAGSGAAEPGVPRAGSWLLVPRLVGPITASRVSSAKPSLTWWPVVRDPVTTEVQLCADRGCSRVLESLSSATGRAAPARALPPGATFWRARTTDGRASSAWSSPWWFAVPWRPSALDVTRGGSIDIDGDALDDVVLTATNGADPEVHVHLGRRDGGPRVAPDCVLPRPSRPFASSFGTALAYGDFDGNGYVDLAVAGAIGLAEPPTPQGGSVFVYAGESFGLATSPTLRIPAPLDETSEFAADLASVGDVDRDGYADLLVLERRAMQPNLRLHLLFGGPAWLDARRSTSLDVAGPDWDTPFVVAGDLNADGFRDVVLGGQGGSLLWVSLHGGLPATLPVLLPKRAADSDVRALGDYDGDGYDDLFVASGAGTQVWFGGSAGLDARRTLVLSRPPNWIAVEPAGDTNANGCTELLLEDEATLMRSLVDGCSDQLLSSFLTPDTRRGLFGGALGGTGAFGDLDGDGFADLVVVGSFGNAVRLFRGPAVDLATPVVELPTAERAVLGD